VEDLETRKEREQELKKEEIKQIRSEVPMVGIQDIGWLLDSDDLELECKINLEMGRRVARGDQQKGSRIWHMIKHMSEDRRLHMRDVLELI